MKDFGNAKSVPGELIGITTAAEGPRIEVEALDIAWASSRVVEIFPQ
jgi:hypothetical protein